MRETSRAKRLHSEAQARYAAKLANAKTPTTAQIIRAIGIAFAAATADAEIVNSGAAAGDRVMSLRKVVRLAMKDLVDQGHDFAITMSLLQRWMDGHRLKRIATKLARDIDGDTGSGPMPSA